jgi:hypothetical protein
VPCRDSSRHHGEVQTVCRSGRRHECRRGTHECVRHMEVDTVS